MISRRRGFAVVRVCCCVLFTGLAFYCLAVPQTGGYGGKLPWVRTWQLPNTPNGMRPHACWHSWGTRPTATFMWAAWTIRQTPRCTVFTWRDDTLRYLGDARAASEAVNNWQTGETCQKFHDRPTFHNGKVYVESLDRSDISDAYLSTRGYHVYAYDVANNTFPT